MARLLVVGGGCRALDLASELRAEGHAVRIATRREARREQIEAAGAACLIADPDRIGTLRYALDNVTLLLWLLHHPDRYFTPTSLAERAWNEPALSAE